MELQNHNLMKLQGICKIKSVKNAYLTFVSNTLTGSPLPLGDLSPHSTQRAISKVPRLLSVTHTAPFASPSVCRWVEWDSRTNRSGRDVALVIMSKGHTHLC